MYDIDLTKKNITAFVNAYKWAFPDEYKAVVKQVAQNRKLNTSLTGAIKGQGLDILERPLHEISETLFTILHNKFSEEELKWWGTNEAAKWFAKTFPEFSRVERT